MHCQKSNLLEKALFVCLFSLNIPPFNRSTSSYMKSSSVHKYESQIVTIVTIVTQINYSDELLPPNIQTQSQYISAGSSNGSNSEVDDGARHIG